MSAKTKHLARLLADAFSDAAQKNGTLDAASAQRLNEWVPGALRFPAVDDTALATGNSEEDDVDIFGALFTGQDDGDGDDDILIESEADLAA